ncbi:hypothetical protein B0H19DRAFT_1003529 [Mycena capillaripes]|nr:hypothetical protein B0H19DRAFT_1003529 [Mycena capillaripes]
MNSATQSLTSHTDTTTQSTTSHPDDRADKDEWAATKLWAVYISEAEKYDKALVEGWKSDMDGLLIFAGLFSASLTAFLVESYKTLSPDQGAMTIALLTQISLQMHNASSGPVASFLDFKPSASSLACNTLWFLSLGLSLSCALIATLVQQWSRDFAERVDMRPSPIIRARIFSYLYFGLQRFGMHTMVEFIPLLLHLSLLFFFAGLVAFLHPISTALMVVAIALLGLISSIYLCLTILPILFSDSPYRTPLSNVAWALVQAFQLLPRRRYLLDEEATNSHVEPRTKSKHTPTMVEVMTRDAVQESGERDKRDNRAIIWTLRSLIDHEELEPFVEALPDLILGNRGLGMYDDMLNMLLDAPDLRLISRVEGLLRSCDSGLLSLDVQNRRRRSCTKSLWAIAYFIAQDVSTRNSLPGFNLELLRSHLNSATTALAEKLYLTSAYTLVRWIRLWSLLSFVRDAEFRLNTISDSRVLLASVQRRAEELGFNQLSTIISEGLSEDPVDGSSLIQTLRGALLSSENTTIFTEYLINAAALDELPNAFEATCTTVMAITAPSVQNILQDTFFEIVVPRITSLNEYGELHHIDIIVGLILPCIDLQESPLLNTKFAQALVIYLASRAWVPQVLAQVLSGCDPTLVGSLLKKYLLHGAGTQTERTIFSIWTMARYRQDSPQIAWAVFDEEMLTTISAAPHFPISRCAAAVIKAHILMASGDLPPNEFDALVDRLHIPRFGSSEEETSLGGADRLTAALFVVLVEFVKEHSSGISLDEWNIKRVADTVDVLVRCYPSECVPPPVLQRSLTTCVRQMMIDDPAFPLYTAIIRVLLFWGHDSPSARLNDTSACAALSEALNIYARTLSIEESGRMGTLNRFRALLNSWSQTGPTPTTPIADVTLPVISEHPESESNQGTVAV